MQCVCSGGQAERERNDDEAGGAVPRLARTDWDASGRWAAILIGFLLYFNHLKTTCFGRRTGAVAHRLLVPTEVTRPPRSLMVTCGTGNAGIVLAGLGSAESWLPQRSPIKFAFPRDSWNTDRGSRRSAFPAGPAKPFPDRVPADCGRDHGREPTQSQAGGWLACYQNAENVPQCCKSRAAESPPGRAFGEAEGHFETSRPPSTDWHPSLPAAAGLIGGCQQQHEASATRLAHTSKKAVLLFSCCACVRPHLSRAAHSLRPLLPLVLHILHVVRPSAQTCAPTTQPPLARRPAPRKTSVRPRRPRRPRRPPVPPIRPTRRGLTRSSTTG
jgi:hypothetical protein